MLIKIKNCCKKAVNFTTRASTCLLATVYWPRLFRRVIIAGVESASIVLQGPILGSLSAFYIQSFVSVSNIEHAVDTWILFVSCRVTILAIFNLVTLNSEHAVLYDIGTLSSFGGEL